MIGGREAIILFFIHTFVGYFGQLMVNWWFGARWFGFLGFCDERIPNQFTIS